MKFKEGKPVIRCSSLDQLISCPASRTIAALLGEVEEDDRFSWEGQWCHDKAAQRFILLNGAIPPEGGLPGPRIPAGWQPESFANWIVDYYHRAVMEETPSDWAMEVESEMLVEFDRFWLSGHCDVDAVSPDATMLNFDDLKSGKNVVDAAERNWQVFGYAVLFKRIWETLRRIRGRIIQPRVKEAEGKRITSVIIDERGAWNDEGQLVSEITIDTMVAALERAVNEALDNPMILNLGLKQCRWCPADLQCPAQIAERNRMKMELTKEALAAIEATPNDRLLAEWALAKRMLDSKLKKAWDLLKARLEKSGGTIEIDDVKLMLTDWQGAREFPPEKVAEIWEMMVADLGEEAYGAMSIGIPDLEATYAKVLRLPVESKKKDSGEKQVANRFGDFITRKQGKQLTIVG